MSLLGEVRCQRIHRDRVREAHYAVEVGQWPYVGRFVVCTTGANVILSAFDPKPFIRSFEAAVDKLISVRKDVQAKTEQMERTVRVSEREYSKKMADLNKGFEVRILWPLLDDRSLIVYRPSEVPFLAWKVV